MNRRGKVVAGLVIAACLMAGAALATSAVAAGAHQSKPRAQQRTNLVDYVASVVGVTPAVLRQDLQAGKTLFQIAGNNYASPDDLATALLKPVKTWLDGVVSKGTITTAQEGMIYNELHRRVARLVVTPHPRLAMLLGPQRAAVRGLKTGLINTFAATCHTTAAALKTAFMAGGKTPLAICQATNPAVTQDDLVNALMAPIKARVQAAAATNPTVASLESQLLSRVQAGLRRWVVTPLPTGGFGLS